jgi:hypothetical protein
MSVRRRRGGALGQRDDVAIHRRVRHRRVMHGGAVRRHRRGHLRQRQARDRRSDGERSDGHERQPGAGAQSTADRVHGPL